jgi:DNA polymerase III delta subunit
MLYVVYGNDVVQVRARAFERVETLTKGVGATRAVTSEAVSVELLQSLAGATSLFGGAECIVLDTIKDDVHAFEILMGECSSLKASPNLFVLIEGTLIAGEKKVFEKYAEEMVEVKGEPEQKFNTFLLTDALLSRDKKSLWVLLMRAWQNRISTEAIIGMLFWQLKILRLAERTKSADEAGQKEFVYNKSKRALTKFKKGEIDTLSRDLLALYHEGHSGKRNIEGALEQWVLRI